MKTRHILAILISLLYAIDSILTNGSSNYGIVPSISSQLMKVVDAFLSALLQYVILFEIANWIYDKILMNPPKLSRGLI